MSAQDDMARLRAEADQVKEGTREFAGILWNFYSALVQQGFTEEQALTFSLTWFQSLLTSSTLGDIFGGGE